MFEKATRLPEPGSPMEMIFLLIWKMRQDIEFHKSRATMQALLAQKDASQKEIMDAFDMLKEAFFPFDRNQKGDEIRRMKEAMQQEIARGPIQVTPLDDPGRKKVASRLVQGQQELGRQHQMQQTGKTVSIDAYDRARRRPRNVS